MPLRVDFMRINDHLLVDVDEEERFNDHLLIHVDKGEK